MSKSENGGVTNGTDGEQVRWSWKATVKTMGQKSMEALLSAVVGAVVGGMGVWFYTQSPHLSYSISEPVRFDGESNKFGIVNVTVTNDGRKEAESVEMMIRLPSSGIKEVRVFPQNIKPKSEIKGGTWESTLPHLNPGETLQLSLLTSETGGPETRADAKVDVRAKGVVGEEFRPARMSIYWVYSGLAFSLLVFLHAVSQQRAREKAVIATLERVNERSQERLKDVKDFYDKVSVRINE